MIVQYHNGFVSCEIAHMCMCTETIFLLLCFKIPAWIIIKKNTSQPFTYPPITQQQQQKSKTQERNVLYSLSPNAILRPVTHFLQPQINLLSDYNSKIIFQQKIFDAVHLDRSFVHFLWLCFIEKKLKQC